MKYLTKKEIFLKVREHLRTQGEPALNEDDQCAYRSTNGKMCAIGCLIPDELYDPKIEGAAPTMQPTNEPAKLLRTVLKESGINVDDEQTISFLEVLQAAHDDKLTTYGFEAWESQMEKIAGWFKIEGV
jgi:hypothetical protein